MPLLSKLELLLPDFHGKMHSLVDYQTSLVLALALTQLRSTAYVIIWKLPNSRPPVVPSIDANLQTRPATGPAFRLQISTMRLPTFQPFVPERFSASIAVFATAHRLSSFPASAPWTFGSQRNLVEAISEVHQSSWPTAALLRRAAKLPEVVIYAKQIAYP